MLAFQDIDAITGEVIRNAEVATPVVEPATTEDLISIS
jgi:hypothetical protein